MGLMQLMPSAHNRYPSVSHGTLQSSMEASQRPGSAGQLKKPRSSHVLLHPSPEFHWSCKHVSRTFASLQSASHAGL